MTVQIGKDSLDSAERILPEQIAEFEVQIAFSGSSNFLKLTTSQNELYMPH